MNSVITNDVLNATVPFPREDNLMKIVYFQRPGKSPGQSIIIYTIQMTFVNFQCDYFT